jgi:uncharacterized membrane protein YgdD (TMEM256/DUF423 family)
MLKRATVLLLVVLLGCYAAPVSAQTLTEEQWTAQFTTELSDYAATHSEEETRAYAQSRLDQLTYSNLIPESTTVLEAGISPEVLYGTGAWSDTSTIYLDMDYEFNLDGKLRECTARKQEQCRTQYNSDLLTSAAISTGVFAGCNAISGLSAFIICTAAAFAAHMLMIQAARQRYQTCQNNAAWECRKELGML